MSVAVLLFVKLRHLPRPSCGDQTMESRFKSLKAFMGTARYKLDTHEGRSKQRAHVYEWMFLRAFIAYPGNVPYRKVLDCISCRCIFFV